MPVSVSPTLHIVDRAAARAAAQRPRDADGDVVRDPTSRAGAHHRVDAAGVAAARGHHRRRARRGHEAGRIQRLGWIALAAGVEAIGDWAVRTLVALEY